MVGGTIPDFEFKYEGCELDLFANAYHWRNHWSRQIFPYLGKSVLEVGAGIGSTTKLLASRAEVWTALEPDSNMAAQIADYVDSKVGAGGSTVKVKVGSLQSLQPDPRYDSILYIDVLEHIKSDAAEVKLASEMLNPGGHLVLLTPAHQFLYTPFDAAIGHYRRYNRRTIDSLRPGTLTTKKSRYLDSMGMLASFGNKLLLNSSQPTRKQIVFWDRILGSSSTITDPLLNFRIGKSLLTVWQKS